MKNKIKPILAYLDEETHKELRRVAFNKNVSMTSIIRKLIKTHIKRNKLIAIFAIFSLISPCVHAQNITEETAVSCIIGESASQGFHGMLVLAEALRNRGTTKGVYGCTSDLYKRQPKWVHKKALVAWRESATTNFTHGADHWENVKAFGEPFWVKSMVKIYEYKDHVFYKEVK